MLTTYMVLLFGGVLWTKNITSVFLIWKESLSTDRTKTLYAMFNCFPTKHLVKQVVKFAMTRLNVLSRWHIVPSGHYTILEIDLVIPVNIKYLPAISWYREIRYL